MDERWRRIKGGKVKDGDLKETQSFSNELFY